MKLSTYIGTATLIFSTFFSMSFSVAETVVIPINQQGQQQNTPTPHKGATQQQVIDNFGTPASKSGAVGDPPIDRWDYDDFSVYFEYDRVIHSVHKHVDNAK